MCVCSDLIGRPYRLGADGSTPEIDCIHMVYTVLDHLGITTPAFQANWYTASPRQVLRELYAWGTRVKQPEYDGDVVLLATDHWAFGVTWQSGILYINRHLNKVAWCPLSSICRCHCFRTRSN